jgi:hypothetical protein
LSSLIQARDAHNVAIVGHGAIDGNRVFNPDNEERMRGPHTVLFCNCRDLTIHDVAVRDSSNYAFLLLSCQNGSIDGVSVTGGWDGVHMNDSQDVTISNCRFFTGDDCLAGTLWKDVTVTNCILNTSCNGCRIGGQEILINNCLIYGLGAYEHCTCERHNLEAGIWFWGTHPWTATGIYTRGCTTAVAALWTILSSGTFPCTTCVRRSG